MKSLYASLILGILAASCDQSHPVESTQQSTQQETRLPDNLTSEEQAFLDDVRLMFSKRNISPMMALVHKEGVEDWWLDTEKDYLKDVLKGGLGELELVRIDPPRKQETLMDGSIAEWSLPLKWELIVHQPSGDSMMNVSHTISLSEHEGKIVSIRQISHGKQDAPLNP